MIDGDTIKNVHIAIAKGTHENKDVFPGLIAEGGVLYRIANVQIRGIDAPERHPHKKGRSDISRQREKSAAEKAATALDEMLSKHNYEFFITNPEEGSFGRIIADVVIMEQKGGIMRAGDWIMFLFILINIAIALFLLYLCFFNP